MTQYAVTLTDSARKELRDLPSHVIDACAKVRGLLTDEEVDTLFKR